MISEEKEEEEEENQHWKPVEWYEEGYAQENSSQYDRSGALLKEDKLGYSATVS